MFGALMLGVAMAFGLGGQAKILLEEQFRAKKKRDTDATLHLWLDGHDCQPLTPKRSLVSSLGVGN
jgi:hypothetical protein